MYIHIYRVIYIYCTYSYIFICVHMVYSGVQAPNGHQETVPSRRIVQKPLGCSWHWNGASSLGVKLLSNPGSPKITGGVVRTWWWRRDPPPTVHHSFETGAEFRTAPWIMSQWGPMPSDVSFWHRRMSAAFASHRDPNPLNHLYLPFFNIFQYFSYLWLWKVTHL